MIVYPPHEKKDEENRIEEGTGEGSEVPEMLTPSDYVKGTGEGPDESFALASDTVAGTKPENLQEYYAALNRLLREYYKEALQQSKSSFTVALVAGAIGVASFWVLLLFL